jgi:hypothetical protein
LFGIALLATFFIVRSRSGVNVTRIESPPGGPVRDGVGGTRVFSGREVFRLNPGGIVTIKSQTGNISIEGWDKPQVEVEVSRAAGRENRDAAVIYSSSDDHFTLTAPESSYPGGSSLRLKVPRELENIAIGLANGTVKLSDVNAIIKVAVDNGNIEMDSVSGSADANVGLGNISVSFDKVGPDGPLSFVAGKGNVDLKFGSDINARLEAETGVGNLRIDPDFGLTTERGLITQRAFGQLGDGGRPLTVRVGVGNIKIAK